MERASRDVLPSRSRVINSEGRTLRFADFDLRPEILKALADLGYEGGYDAIRQIGRAHV